MVILPRLVLTVTLLTLLGAMPAAAAEGDTTIYGGPGGGGFLDRCQDGWVLK